jgi:hypothetical protein
MAVLANYIAVVGRFARSASLERDIARREPLDGYVVTARALDVVERIAAAAANGAAGGAWSLTGPYGSGKSSLALLLDAAFGERGATRTAATELIEAASPAVADLLGRAHQARRTAERGFHRAVVTASREPLHYTILRALQFAVTRTYGNSPSTRTFRAAKTLKTALADAASDDPRRIGPSPADLLEVARCLAEDAPLLLIIDEFGKNLEAISDGSDADPYLLQQLAEAGQGAGLPIFALTLQHLSFEDYLTSTDGPQRREWAKVQGRFEDVAYIESAAQTRALIGTVFAIDNGLQSRIRRWAKTQAKEMRALGVADLASSDVVEACYPLHPLVALVLPELCSRYGQHERTLFSFLTGADSATAASFLSATPLPARGALPSLGLDAVYDYFVAGGVSAVGYSQRWSEIATRLRDAHGLTESQTKLAKSIAILNLVSSGGAARASAKVLGIANNGAATALTNLQDAGIVTYRDFADEFRIWHGTDVDIHGLIKAAHAKVQRQPLVEILAAIHKPEPVVAARHSAEHDLLRVFARRYVDGTEPVTPLDPFSPYDGEVLLTVAPDAMPTFTQAGENAKPVVAAIPDDLTRLNDAAREVAAVADVLDHDSVKDDWVARREIGERLAQTETALSNAIEATFNAKVCRWVLLGSDGPSDLPAGRGSAALSAAADRAYSKTPTVSNEMLNRTAVTPQGAKARRILLEAMIEFGNHIDLNLEGHGPEVAMYHAFIKGTGMHGWDQRNEVMVFRSPTDKKLKPAWALLDSEFDRASTRRINLADIYAALLSPPIGMKAEVIPVFVTVGLLAYSDEVAIYEHGTFRPLLTTDLSERMVRNPKHFDIKHFANTSGARRQVIEALASRLEVRPRFRKHRVSNVLAVVGELVSQVRQLDNYTRRTRNLSDTAAALREALAAAVEPDELLFTSIPEALGFRPIPAATKTYSKANEYADAVASALEELTSSYQRLVDEMLDELFSVSGETSRLTIAEQAAALDGEVLDSEVRAFVLALANDGIDSDIDWIQTIATVVAKKAPAEWTDADCDRFRTELSQQVASFQRLVALHAAGADADAMRLTVTRADGTEYVRLVGVDQDQRDACEGALDDALARLTNLTGSPARAQQTLLALLGERLLPAPEQDAPTEERRQHG